MFWVILTTSFWVDSQLRLNSYVPRFAKGQTFETRDACNSFLHSLHTDDQLPDNYRAQGSGLNYQLELRASDQETQILQCVSN